MFTIGPGDPGRAKRKRADGVLSPLVRGITRTALTLLRNYFLVRPSLCRQLAAAPSALLRVVPRNYFLARPSLCGQLLLLRGSPSLCLPMVGLLEVSG